MGSDDGLQPKPYSVRKEIEILKHRLWVGGCTYAVLVVFVLSVAWLVLHAYSAYWSHLDTYTRIKADGRALYEEMCKSGKGYRFARNVNCDQATQDMHISVQSKTLEATVATVLGDLLMLPSLGCTSNSTCAYVIWKSIDTVFSSTALLLVVIALFLLGSLWTGYANVYQPWHKLQFLRRAMQAPSCRGDSVHVQVGGQTKHTKVVHTLTTLCFLHRRILPHFRQKPTHRHHRTRLGSIEAMSGWMPAPEGPQGTAFHRGRLLGLACCLTGVGAKPARNKRATRRAFRLHTAVNAFPLPYDRREIRLAVLV